MARKLRVEFPGAVYHVINRGNRRVGPFEAATTRDAFEGCLFEACVRSRWLLHAYTIMSNHFHLAVETPEGNLGAGMQWLQSTFTNRYNRFRGEAGYGSIFQGRYKALLVERGTALGMVCDYVHLNPVRAHLVTTARLADWRWSSYRWLTVPDRRPAWLRVQTALSEAGGLVDRPAGWRAYQKYLEWQTAEGPAATSDAYVSMSRGWALGSDAFRAELVEQFQLGAFARAWEVAGADEVRALRGEAELARCLRELGKERANPKAEPKAAAWKVAIAAWMKSRTDVSNSWMADRLCMGSCTRVSQLLGLLRRKPDLPAAILFRRLSETLAA